MGVVNVKKWKDKDGGREAGKDGRVRMARKDGCMDEWTDEEMYEWMVEWVDEWMDRAKEE